MKRNQFIKSTLLGMSFISLDSPIYSLNSKPSKNDLKHKLKSKIIRKDTGVKQIVLGDNQTIKLTGKDTNGLYTLIEQYNNPGMEIPMHVHKDEDEVFHVLEGKLEINVDNTITTLNPGDIGFCPRGIPHSWKVIGDQKTKVMLSIFPSGLEHMFKELTMLPQGPPNFNKVAEICKRYNINFIK